MAGVITTGNIPKAMWPGVKFWFGRQYKEHSPEYVDLYELEKSDKGWEELVELTGFGLPIVKTQNTGTHYDSEVQGVNHQITHVAYGLGFQVTREERDDNQYAIVGKRRARALAFSFRQGKEIVAANVYNRAVTAGYTGGDGQVLGSTTHPTVTGSQSNILATASDLCEVAVEDLVIMIMTAKNSKGLRINLRPKSLHVHANNFFEAHRLYDSTKQSGTANNDSNVLKDQGIFPQGVKVNHYFDDTDMFFIRTDCPASAVFLQRVQIEFKQDNDFDTDNAKYKGYERYSCGWGDWRGVYLTPGA
jgi:hypothetical protein